MRPHFAAVVGDKNRDVADQADTALGAMFLERLPLPIELVLHKLTKCNFVSMHALGFAQGARLTQAQCLIPLSPIARMIGLAQGTK